MSILSKFRSFLTKHSDELGVVANALTTLFNALPIPATEKRSIQLAINGLETSAANIAKSAERMTESVLTLTDADRKSIASKLVQDVTPDLTKLIERTVTAQLDKLTKATAPATPATPAPPAAPKP